ncbi:hypothetical protein C7C46_00250 [Streptomyces tateyamensis]|uniref:Uncharacterized protein n=1 Tax=Streptomyces tateyamensis TaxID=565073 RepID=A0A2V4PTE4_9ACTN|nr:hypothetical protein [Streptomyces tateyamensis]PYC88475.1 hypothetical protein C7C46_00250 [Streptomyces tateyamensis]
MTGYPNPMAAAAIAGRRQASAAAHQFTSALVAAEVELPDPVEGFRITPTGTVLVQLRPLLPTELLLLALALGPTDQDSPT